MAKSATTVVSSVEQWPEYPVPLPDSTRPQKARDLHREWYWSVNEYESYVCPKCDSSTAEYEATFHVHHRDGNHLNGHPRNLLGVCPRCHRKIHHARATMVRLQAWKREYSDLYDL